MKPTNLTGQVSQFQGNGRRLGYPTANIRTGTDLTEGVYFGFADLAEFSVRPSLIFIGVPTTMGDPERRLEVHVLDIPDIDYYDKKLTVQIVHFLRANKHFDNVEALKLAMRDDEMRARNWFVKNPLAPADNPKHT